MALFQLNVAQAIITLNMKSSDAKYTFFFKIKKKILATMYRFLCKYWYFWMDWGWDLVHLKWKYFVMA